jgi:hypothetical protein
MTKVVGLCKTFSCAEFMPAVMDVLYKRLDKIVFVHSDVDWLGRTGTNEVREWFSVHPEYAEKTFHVMGNFTDQNKQYDAGWEYIVNNTDADWVVLFDTDEVWGEDNLSLLLHDIEQCADENAVTCRMFTYIKSPLYRIDPPEPLQPVAAVRALPGILRGVRGNRVGPVKHSAALMHHFSYVRDVEDKVFDKIRTSTKGDHAQHVDLQIWKNEKWDHLPAVKNFHTTRGFERNWQGVRVITPEELPAAVLALDWVQAYLQKEGLK